MTHFYRGLIIVEPYGTYIKNRTKNMIVKSRKISTIVGTDLLLIENKLGLGVIQLDGPIQISLPQFKKWYKYHQIIEEDREKWWGRYNHLYAYPIIKSRFFKQPLMLNYSTGPQITVTPNRIHLKKIWIGMAGYYYRYMYPKSVKNILEYYTERLNSVEINSTFYNFPPKSSINNLIKYNLVYSIKVNRHITHTNELLNVKKSWNDFYHSLELLHDQIGCFLFQFSKNFYYNSQNYQRLKALSTILNKHHRYAFEFRHKSWFNNPKINKLLKKNNWSLVIVHVTNTNNWAGDLDNGFNPPLSKYQTTSDVIYFRMHGTKGKYIGGYSNKQLEQIVEFIGQKTAKNIFIYFNNTDSDSDAFKDPQKLNKKINVLNQ